MRRNTFNDTYCHTAAELRAYVDEHSDGAVYVGSIDPPENANEKATAEVLENESGDTVCFVEADTVDLVRAILVEVGIEIQ